MQKWYIYYNSDGKIYSVTNEKKESGDFIETVEENIKDFISGKKRFENFTVRLNSFEKIFKENKERLSLKFCNLEKPENVDLKYFDFYKYNLHVYKFLEGNYNFPIEMCVYENEESLNNMLFDSSMLMKRVIKND